MNIDVEKKFAAGISITSNAVIIFTKLIAGVMSGSISIISEAIHSLSDFLASVLTFFAVTRSAEPADKEHPFGHTAREVAYSPRRRRARNEHPLPLFRDRRRKALCRTFL